MPMSWNKFLLYWGETHKNDPVQFMVQFMDAYNKMQWFVKVFFNILMWCCFV